MRNIFKYLMFFGILFSVFSCAEDELPNPTYEGESLLHFGESVEGSYVIDAGSTYKEVDVTFGTISNVSSDNQVTLVLDAAKSTAVAGVDFQIVQNTVTVGSGQNKASFKVRLLEAGATSTVKTAVFKLQSSSLKNAVFNQEYTLKMSLTCSVSYFMGSGVFRNTTAYWMAPAGTDYTIQNVTTGGLNQFVIKNYMDDGSDLKVNYNPSTYAVTIPVQSTGYSIAQGTVYAGDPTSGSTSSFNPCTRVLTLNVYWHVRNAAGNIVAHYNSGQPAAEVFTGQ